MISFLNKLITKIPKFLKSKTFLFLMGGLVLLFLLTPLSVIQINQKVSDIINQKAEQGILQFEKQTGLRIRWESLNFNLLLLRVELKEVFISNSFNPAARKNLLFDFLNGPQFLAEVSLRPRVLYSFLKGAIHLSSVKIQGGEFHLKTVPFSKKETLGDKTLNLPVQRFFITGTHLKVQHKENKLSFSHILMDIRKTGYEDYKFKSSVKSASINQTDPFEFQTKGHTSGDQLFIKYASLKNKETDIKTPLLNVTFNRKGIHRMETKSSGVISSSLLTQISLLLNQKHFPVEGLFSYNLHLVFKDRQGLSGNFSVHSTTSTVQNVPLKTLSFQGKFEKEALSIHNGLIETKNQAQIQIKELKLFYESHTDNPAFILSVNTRLLPVDFIWKNILHQSSFFPITSLISGTLNCAGVINFSHVNCKGDVQTPQLTIQTDESPIVSLRGMRVDLDGTWKDSILKFNFAGQKNDTTKLNGSGQYIDSTETFSLKLNGFSLLKEDIQFAVPFPMEGSVQITNGIFKLKEDQFSMNGQLSSGDITIDRYNIKNVTGSVQMKNEVLSFKDIRGRTGKSVYNGTVIADFKEKKVNLKIISPFLDIENLKTILKKDSDILSDFKIRGTGEGLFEMVLPFSDTETSDFHLTGHLFNVQINKDFFPGVNFDIIFQNNSGSIRSLAFRKGRGSITGTGQFDKDFNLNISLTGTGIPLERLEFLNSLLLLNQSGSVNFSGRLTGPVLNPEFKGSGEITNAVFYSYPVDNSQLKITLSRNHLSLSGNLMNELLLEELSYDFKKKNSLYIKTKLYKWDFINLFLARMKQENLREFSSKLTGEMELNIRNNNISGLIKIDDLLISQGNKWLKNRKSFFLYITPSTWTVSPVQLEHYNNKVLEIKNSAKHQQTVSGHTYLELWSLWFPFFQLMEGEANINFSMNKNLKSFKPKGEIAIHNGFLSMAPLAGFTDINTKIKLDHNKIIIPQFNSLYGEGTVNGQGMLSYSYGKQPPVVNCILNFSDSRMEIPEGFHTRGNGSLTIKGNQPPYLIKGNYAIDSGNILRDWSAKKESDFINNNLLFSQKDKPDDSVFYLDLKILAQKPLLIKNSIIRAPALGTLHVHGPLKNLLLDGTIKLAEDNTTGHSGIITFRDREFEINTASVIFNNSPPDNPLLKVTAQALIEAKIIDKFLSSNQEIKKQYRIFLTADGSLKNLKISLNSTPYLSEKEIISLLAFGMETHRFDENIKENITQYSTQFLGSYFLQKHLGKELSHILNLKLDTAPYLNTRSEEPVATKVTLRKDWFKNLQTSVSRTIEENPVSDARVKYNLKKNISLTAFWEDTEKILENETEKDTAGLDLEFHFEF